MFSPESIHLATCWAKTAPPEAGPLQRWLAHVGFERLREIENSQLAAWAEFHKNPFLWTIMKKIVPHSYFEPSTPWIPPEEIRLIGPIRLIFSPLPLLFPSTIHHQQSSLPLRPATDDFLDGKGDFPGLAALSVREEEDMEE